MAKLDLSDSEKNLKNEVIDLFRLQYYHTAPYIDRFNKIQQLYNQIIDPNTWDTSSEITLGQGYAVVQNMLPAIMFYTLWAPEVPFELIPRSAEVDYDVARKVREDIIYTQRENMNLDWEGLYAIQNALKFGVGYTLVEPKTIQQPGFGATYAAAGAVKERVTTLDIGEDIEITSARNIPVGRIYPSPDGSEPQDVSAVSFLDYVDEFTFKKAFTRDNSPFEGGEEKAQAIIDYVKQNKMSGWTSTPRLYADYLAGNRSSLTGQMNSTSHENAPALVPILKQYRPNQHTWLAADQFPIYNIQDKFQTLTKPIAKATYSPEGGQWFSDGVLGRAYDILAGNETWVNAMFDFLSISLHPHKIVNVDAHIEEDIMEDVDAYGVTRVRGLPSNAIDFVRFPDLPSQAFAAPAEMQGYLDTLTGGSPSASSAPAGLTRGGTGAVESLLQTSSGRDKLSAKNIENGWYKQVSEQTLIHQQMLVEDKSEFVRLRTADESTEGRKVGDKFFELASVSADEIRQQWRFEFNFREKLRNSMGEASQRAEQYSTLKSNPKVNQEELLRWYIGDEFTAGKLLEGVDEEANIALMERLAMAQNAQQDQQPQGNPADAGRGIGLNV